jgi:hypothetical protein
MVGNRVQRRPASSLLLIGLILLVASHLLGALHGPGFVGPHQPLTVGGVTQSAAVAETAVTESDHGHGHDHEVFEDTVAHAVDRVRDSADHPAHAPQIAEPVMDRPVTSALSGRADPSGGDPGPPGGRSACARLCVWRQ